MIGFHARRAGVVAALGVGALLVAGCGSGGSDASGREVHVKLTEWAVHPDRAEVPAGKVTFEMVNEGGVVHELVVVRSDEEPDSWPVDEDGMFDERSKADLTFLDEVEDVEPGGGTAKLTLDLGPGRYVLVCNKPPVPGEGLPAHFAEKMYASFTVTG